MMALNYSKSLVILILLGFATTAYPAYHIYIKSRKKRKSLNRQINEVLLFSQVTPSKLVQSKYSRNLIHPSTDRLLYCLSLSRHTLDICMYMITYHDIAHMLQKLHNKGLKIRIIVDADMAYATASVAKRIEKQGIELRWMKSTNLMHHKFCLIDASVNIEDGATTPFVMIGSLNWTHQALLGNWENVLITSKKEIVEGLREEFENLWLKFKPIDK